MILKCRHCGHVWNYKGKKKITNVYVPYATCPKCLWKVSLNQEVKDIQSMKGGND